MGEFDLNQGLDTIVSGLPAILSPQNTPPAPNTAPAGAPASAINVNKDKMDYTPWIIGAAALVGVVAVVMIAKK